MTLVEQNVGVVEMSEAAAREITELIQRTGSILWGQIIRAYQGRAWAALGYSSWDDYCDAEFDGARLKLPREERTMVVGSLADAGMSTRAIAAATGLGHGTVARSLAEAPVPNGTPGLEDEIVDAEVVAETPGPRQVTGTDGKTYTVTPKPVEWNEIKLPFTAEEQRAIDLSEAAARTARALERISSCWPCIDHLATSEVDREAVLALLTDLDRRRIEHIEAHITNRPLFPNGTDPEAS